MKNYKEIPLTQGQVALVDEEWFDYLNQWKWSAIKLGRSHTFYAKRTKRVGPRKENKSITILMHRVIADVKDGMIVDHIDGNTLDNRQVNLRSTTQAVNMQNKHRLRSDNKSGAHCVFWSKLHKSWRAIVTRNGKRMELGLFKDLNKAKEAVLQLVPNAPTI